MVLGFRYRLLPRKAQHRALERILESQRQLYNAALEERIGAYRKAGKTLGYHHQCKGLAEWRHSDPEARELPYALQRSTLKRLDVAYRGFFTRLAHGLKAGLPRFQGIGRFNSFTFGRFDGITLKDGRLRFKGMPGALRVHWHRDLPPSTFIKRCRFKRDGRGWMVIFDVTVQPRAIRPALRCVGVDLGIVTFAALSDGGFIPSLRAARRAEKRLRTAQRSMERKTKGSNRRQKARAEVSRAYATTARQRREHLHQASARLIRDYDVIAIEKLQVGDLARSALAKDVLDASWGRFISFLRYKAEWAGAHVIEVDPYNTSQDCSGCGNKVPKDLDQRRHDCPHCGISIDRDLNAARNILSRAGVGPGLRNVAGCGMRADGNLLGEGISRVPRPSSHCP
jgi:putative transposase